MSADRIPDVRHPENVGRRPDRTPDARHPEKVRRRPDRIPDARHPEKVGRAMLRVARGFLCVCKEERESHVAFFWEDPAGR